MKRLGRKQHTELEDEEAARLVRSVPRVKPARRDRRRNRVQTDSDSDGDDVKRDQDMSLNYKGVSSSAHLSIELGQVMKERNRGSRDLLGAIKEWLAIPVLSSRIVGVSPYSQIRAALDLACRKGSKGNGSVVVPRTGSANRQAWSDGNGRSGGNWDMRGFDTDGDNTKVTKRDMRSFAGRIAETDPEVAYALLEATMRRGG